jgi:hypothetical protein
MTLNPKMENENLRIEDENLENYTFDDVVNILNDNKLLIGGIVAATGAAFYLFGTDSGKRVRTEIQDRVLDAYDVVSEQVTNGWERLNAITQDMLSKLNEKQGSDDIRKVA